MKRNYEMVIIRFQLLLQYVQIDIYMYIQGVYGRLQIDRFKEQSSETRSYHSHVPEVVTLGKST